MGRGGGPGKPTSFRLSEADVALMQTLEELTGLERVEVLRLALRMLKRTIDVAPAVAVQVLPEELKTAHRRKAPGRTNTDKEE